LVNKDKTAEYEKKFEAYLKGTGAIVEQMGILLKQTESFMAFISEKKLLDEFFEWEMKKMETGK